MNLTVEQRRMVVEYFATKCVEEMPSEEMPRAEFFRDLHSEEWRLQTMKAIEKVIPEQDWQILITELLNYQSFDRNPEEFTHSTGEVPSPAVILSWRHSFTDHISHGIDVVARY